MADTNDGSASGGIGLVTVLLALVFLFIWPGVLRYEYREPPTAKAAGEMATVKIDRLTHSVYDYDSKTNRWIRR